MESQTIAVTLSPDVIQLLSENELDLLAELQKQHLAVQRTGRPAGLPPQEVGTKSVELIILASAAAAPLVANAIARVIDAVSRGRRKQALITQHDQERSVAKGQAGSSPQDITHSAHSINVSFLGLKVELVDSYG